MLTPEQLGSLAAAAHTTAAADQLVDITDISIDPMQPPHARIARFVRDIENPYMLRVKNTTVRISFANNGPPLSQLLEDVARIKHC